MQTGVKHTCEYRPVDQLIGARSSPHDTRLANQEERNSNAETDQVLGKLDKRQYVQIRNSNAEEKCRSISQL